MYLASRVYTQVNNAETHQCPFPGLSMELGQARTQSVLHTPAFLPSSSSLGTSSIQRAMTSEATWGALSQEGWKRADLGVS